MFLATKNRKKVSINKIHKNLLHNKIIIFFIRGSWGEVDAFLPLLNYLSRSLNYQIITIILKKKVKQREFHNKKLANQINELSTLVFFPFRFYSIRYKTFKILKRIINKLFKTEGKQNYVFSVPDIINLFAKESVKFIFKDHTGINHPKIELVEKAFNNAKKIIHPHSTMPMLYQDDFTVIPGLGETDNPADYLIAGNVVEKKWHEKRFPSTEIIDYGFPRYDREWIAQIQKEIDNKKHEDLRTRYSKIFTYFARHPHPQYLPLSEFNYLINSVAETVSEYENSYLFIKTHPRTEKKTINQMKKIFNRYLKGRFSFTSLPPMDISLLSDFIISVYSSAMSDALVVKKPVIEFYEFSGPDKSAFVKLKDGSSGSSYKYLDLVPSVKRKEELKEYINDYFDSNGNSRIWKKQRENVMKYFKLDKNIIIEITKKIENN